MKHILSQKIDTIITIALLFVAISGGTLFEDNILYLFYTCIIVIISLIVYDYAKYFFYKEFMIPDVDWLYSTNRRHWVRNLMMVEESVSNDAIIYIITDNLYLDTENKETVRMVSDNLKRNVIYIFITSDSEKNKKCVCELAELHARSENRSIVTVSENLMRARTLGNVMIISDPKKGGLGAYMQLPVGGESWWIKLDEDRTNQAFDNIQGFLRDSATRVRDGFDPLVRFGRSSGDRR